MYGPAIEPGANGFEENLNMTDETHPANPTGHGDYERRDIGAAGVLYFLAGLAIFAVIIHFVVAGVYDVLDKRTEAQQAPVSPLVTNAPADTRHLPPQYKTDAKSTDYEKYLEQNFPAPQLETDEHTQLNKVRQDEAETLSTYGWVDQKAGTVRIPIDRAMDLIAQRGLSVRGQATTGGDVVTKSKSKGSGK
jgi:hypothetical protein